MLKLTQLTAVSLLALAAMLALPGSAQAACTPALTSDTSLNTCVGTGALLNNVPDNGANNTAIGYDALRANTTGDNNTASGIYALYSNTEGDRNTAMGFGAAAWTTGSNNIALGFEAGRNLTTGSNNIAIGSEGVAGESNTIRIGTAGTQTRAFLAGIRGVPVTGGQAVVIDANGQLGSAAGGLVPVVPGTGGSNTALGTSALISNTTGNNNTASGVYALGANTSGSNNIALGFEAGKNLTTGSNNIAIGNAGVAGDDNTIRIGGTQTAAFMAGITFSTSSAISPY